ncbi:hypothetical protein Pisl_1551 [Pyrobaculum islandicum DSM 4184]|uniref:Uncharacterized protein n=1 Tax=Pyrobaculum islandicum (strain DSM 4184 / JCM 9189 / GEO3) TaxID=384616 RepID=A1RUS4_PYRIL|nr:hypothetical protein Pisl_1551 [Pyrobaculum islandicum DSM 4184]
MLKATETFNTLWHRVADGMKSIYAAMLIAQAIPVTAPLGIYLMQATQYYQWVANTALFEAYTLKVLTEVMTYAVTYSGTRSNTANPRQNKSNRLSRSFNSAHIPNNTSGTREVRREHRDAEHKMLNTTGHSKSTANTWKHTHRMLRHSSHTTKLLHTHRNSTSPNNSNSRRACIRNIKDIPSNSTMNPKLRRAYARCVRELTREPLPDLVNGFYDFLMVDFGSIGVGMLGLCCIVFASLLTMAF